MMGLKRVRKRLMSQQVEEENGTAPPNEEKNSKPPVTRPQAKPSPEVTRQGLFARCSAGDSDDSSCALATSLEL